MSDGVGPTFSTEVFQSLITFCGIVIVGFIGFFGGRGSVQAQLQAQLNDTMKMVIAELKAEIDNLQGHIRALEGRSASLEQYNISLARILRDANIEVPPPPKTETVFILASPNPGAH